MRSAPRSIGRRAGLFAALTLVLPCAAPEPARDDPEATVVDELVVNAILPGPAWWKVSDADSSVYVMGLPAVVNRGLDWDDSVLRRRLNRSRRLVMPPSGEVAFPAGGDSVAQWPADLRERVGQLADRLRGPASRRLGQGVTRSEILASRPAGAALLLLAAYYDTAPLSSRVAFDGFRPLAVGAGISDFPTTTVPVQRLGPGDWEEEMACLRRTLDKIEGGSARDLRAAAAWAEGEVRAALDADRIYDQCLLTMPGGAEMLRTLHEAEVETIAKALSGPRPAVAAMPLRSLIVSGGVLERLRARGFTVKGPDVDTEPLPAAPMAAGAGTAGAASNLAR